MFDVTSLLRIVFMDMPYFYPKLFEISLAYLQMLFIESYS